MYPRYQSKAIVAVVVIGGYSVIVWGETGAERIVSDNEIGNLFMSSQTDIIHTVAIQRDGHKRPGQNGDTGTLDVNFQRNLNQHR